MTVVLGEMDVDRVSPYRSGQDELPVRAHGLVCTTPASDGHPNPRGGGGEGDSGSAFYPVDDVHRA